MLTRDGNGDELSLAMNESGDFVVTWASDQVFGPFLRLTGTTSPDLRIGRAPQRFGTAESIAPAYAAMSSQGQAAVVYGVRHDAGIRFGLQLARPDSGTQKWRTKVLVRPPASIDSQGIGGVVVGDRGHLAADWAQQAGSGEQLVLAQQTRPGAPVRVKALYTYGTSDLAPLTPAFDSTGGLIIPFTLNGLGCAAAHCTPVADQEMVITTDFRDACAACKSWHRAVRNRSSFNQDGTRRS